MQALQRLRDVHLMRWVFEVRHFGSFFYSWKNRLVAVSFDDGPSLHTRRILEILNDNGVKATFFWIAEVAQRFKEEYPGTFAEILALIDAGKHEIGLHALYDSKPSWKMRIFGQHSKEDFSNAKRILEELTGLPIRLYRPHCIQAGDSICHASELGLTTVSGLPLATVHGIPGIPGYMFPFVPRGGFLIMHEKARQEGTKKAIAEILPLVLAKMRKRRLTQSPISGMFKVKGIAA